ncbi:MAG: D-aminoacylase [Gammaproteobacteria bacterium]|nr:D-aminoacylase [Gammaproteobacteria bacterium]
MDAIIRNAIVIDGTGKSRFPADIGVENHRISTVGDLSGSSAGVELDAGGKIVAPGFIDVHTHDDCALLTSGDMTPKVSQGVTTVVAGNCGVSLAPLKVTGWPPQPLDLLGDGSGYRFDQFGGFVEALSDAPPATNAALLVGHITLRLGAMRDTGRAAGEGEIARMQDGVRDAMAAGAIGFSTGLDYPNAVSSSTEEVVELARVAAEHGGVYASHTRNYFEDVEGALAEAFDIAERAGAPLILSHHQVTGRENFGRSRRTLEMIDEARARIPVALDAYPYDASSKVLDPARCRPGVRVKITWSVPHPEMTGLEIDEVSKRWGMDPVAAAEKLLPAGAVYFQLDEDDVRRILAYPDTMIGSDGLPHDRHPHPRLWGTFPRVLGHYVRDVRLFDLETAIRKMTSIPAEVFGLEDRGVIRTGAFADLVVFDDVSVRDEATYDAPIRPSTGIDLVMVNGVPVWRGGRHTGERPGRLLRRKTG